jgi:hypothetical protein
MRYFLHNVKVSNIKNTLLDSLKPAYKRSARVNYTSLNLIFVLEIH